MEDYKRPLSVENAKAIEAAIATIITALGGDVTSDSLKETPKRVTKMYEEVFQGMQYTNNELVSLFGKCFDEPNARDLVVVSNIPAFSYCEHHMALMYNMKISVAYIPDERVIGLSKIARIVDLVTRRLQLQERIGQDIAYIIEKICNTHDVMVVVDGEHSCMTARGIKKPGTVTHSAVLHGRFRDSQALRQEVYDLIGRDK